MPEKYKGTKFGTVFLKKEIPQDAGIKKLKFWGSKLSLLGLTPEYDFGAAGNLSFRTAGGYIITAAGSNLGSLNDEDFVEVRSCSLDNSKVTVIGRREPSSETMLHCAVYGKRPEIRVIFHVHDEYAVGRCEELGLKCTAKEYPYGSRELAAEVLKIIGSHDYIVMKNHGIISLGATTDEAGERIIGVNGRIKG
ncbi:aldolase [Candidatus Woesearchaeota archaeon]|nr:aldolase [Candidatus Woesearchaeota archaeon]